MRHSRLSSDYLTIEAERSEAEQARVQTEVFYHSLVETIPQMILCKDLDGRFTFANDKFCAELGTTLENFKGKTDFDFFPKELAEKYRRDDKQVLESGQVLDVVEEHVTPKGEKLYVQVMKTPFAAPTARPSASRGSSGTSPSECEPRKSSRSRMSFCMSGNGPSERPTRHSRPRRAAWSRPRSSRAWASSSRAWLMRSTTRWRSSATTWRCSSATSATSSR